MRNLALDKAKNIIAKRRHDALLRCEKTLADLAKHDDWASCQRDIRLARLNLGLALGTDLEYQYRKPLAELLEKAGLQRNVTSSDRKLYKTWTENWFMPAELVEFAVEKSVTASNPMQYANKVLASYKSSGITTVEQAQTTVVAAALPSTTKQTTKQHSFDQHEYTDDEINALFTDLENLEI